MRSKGATAMIKGIGIDLVDIAEMERLCGDLDTAFARRVFTEAEREQAAARHKPAQMLAGKFAAKEAAFKALARLTANGFDFRKVETLEDENGAPHISTGPLAEILAEAGATELLVSITNEGNLAQAIVLAQ